MKLTPLEPEDLDFLYSLENDPEQWKVTSTNVPYSRYALRDYIATQQSDIYADKQLRLVIRVDEKTVGLIDLFNFEPRFGRAEMGVAIIAEQQGKGYAKEAIRLLVHYCRETLNLHQIYCIVPADNKPSLTMLRDSGFANEVTLKDWVQIDGKWVDAIHTQLLFS